MSARKRGAKESTKTHKSATGRLRQQGIDGGLLKKALAVLLALNMAIMLMVPAGAVADHIVEPVSEDLAGTTGSNAQEKGQPTNGAGGGEETSATEPENAEGEGEDFEGALEPEETFEAANEPEEATASDFEADDPDEEIVPLAITPITDIPGGVEVDDWTSFATAWADVSNVSYIRLKNNIARGSSTTDLAVLSRNLVVDGNGFTLDVGTQNRNISMPLINSPMTGGSKLEFTLKNVKINRQTARSNGVNHNTLIGVGTITSGTGGASNGDAAWGHASGLNAPSAARPTTHTDRWTVNLEDVVSDNTQRGGLVNNANGTVKGTGKIEWWGSMVNEVANSSGASRATFATSSATANYQDTPIINARYQIYDGADMDLRTNTCGGALVSSVVYNTDSKIEFKGGTKAEIWSYRPDYWAFSIFMGLSYDRSGATAGNTAANIRTLTIDLVVTDPGTVVNTYSRISGWTDEAGGIAMCGGKGGISVLNGGHLNSYNWLTTAANRQGDAAGAAIMQHIRGQNPGDAYFIVDGEGSKLYAESSTMDRGGESQMHGVVWVNAGEGGSATTQTNCDFRVSNGAVMEVNRVATTLTSGNRKAAGISFMGANNSFTIESGGIVKVENNGGRPQDAQTNATAFNLRNPAINFVGPNWSFDVKDYGSSVELYSRTGAAISGSSNAAGSTINNNNGSVTIGPGAIAIMHGVVDGGAIVNGTQGFEFTFTNPLYYDFANFGTGTATQPARVFRTSTATQVRFESNQSDLAVWGNGSSRVGGTASGTNSSLNPPTNPLWGNANSWADPYMQWTLQTVQIANTASFGSGGSFYSGNTTLLNTAVDNFGNQGMLPYKRVQGNNATPVIKEVLQPTNADKYLRTLGVVPEGLNKEGRAVWTDEVHGRYEILRAQTGATEVSTSGQVLSFNEETGIYEVELTGMLLDGVVRYTDGDLLRSGDIFTMTSLWRGVEFPNAPNPTTVHMAKPEDMPGPITIQDVLPPTPAQINSDNGNKLWLGITSHVEGTWLAGLNQASAEPHNPEPAVKIYAAVNTANNLIMDGGSVVEGTLNPDGTWEYDIPESVVASLNAGDKIYFILEDENNNKNPLIATAIHDTTMAPAPFLTVALPDILLYHTDAFIGTMQAAEIAELGQDTLNQYAELKNVIAAYGEKRNPSVTMSEAVSVINVDGSWEPAGYFSLPEFGVLNPDGKEYLVKYAVDADPSINNTGTVTVLPFEKATPFIGANNFTMSSNNAKTMMAKNTTDRDKELIERAAAQGRLKLVDPFSAANVEVTSVMIPLDGTPGDYEVTFHVKSGGSGPEYYVTIIASIIIGDPPVLNVSNPIMIWIGDGTAPANHLLPGDFDPMDGVSAFETAGGAEIPATSISYTGTYDDTKVGTYPLTYSVTNAQGNVTTAVRTVIVTDGTIVSDGKYILQASSFVIASEDADNSSAALLMDTKAQAWEIDEAEAGGKKPATAAVGNYGAYAKNCPKGDYPIEIKVDAPDTALKMNVVATVIQKDVIGDGTDPDTNIRYAIGANHVYDIKITEASLWTNINDDATKLRMINAAKAEAWKLTDVSTPLNKTGFDLVSLNDAGVIVLSSTIPTSTSNISSGDVFEVTFAVKDSPTITATVEFSFGGVAPVITFDEAPLIIPFEPGSTQNLTEAELKAKMSVLDAQDGDILMTPKTTFVVDNTSGKTISKGVVGVYSVTYTATNSVPLTATATRAVIVDDGRFEIDTDNGIIIGAKNFIIQRSAVQGSADQVRSYSRANAWDTEGHAIASNLLTIDPFPSTYTVGCAVGDYEFPWTVVGYPTVKKITGTVVDADVIFVGGDNDQYAMTANNFEVWVAEAENMLTPDLNASLLAKANVQVYKLVDDVIEAVPYVINNGGFKAEKGDYSLLFGARRTDASNSVVITTPPTQVAPTARVLDRPLPHITATTPLEVWIGAGAAPNAGAILPGAYEDLYQVVATHEEEGTGPKMLMDPSSITVDYLDPTTGVDLTKPGLYHLKFTVTDSVGETDTAERMVVVNDGTYTVGNGRILYARSFVTKLQDVTTDTNMINAEILSKGQVRLIDGETGAPIGTSSTVVVGPGGYGPSVGTYNISLTAFDDPSGTITRNITGEVVDADVIGPDMPPATGSVTYVYGKNIVQTVDEAVTTATTSPVDVQIIKALQAYATKAAVDGTTSKIDVKIVDLDDYVAAFSGAIPADPTELFGVYRFDVTDIEDKTTIQLTIMVGTDKMPSISATPKPLNVTMPVASTEQSGGNLTDAKIKEGVVASDPNLSDVIGNVTTMVVYEILDVTEGTPGTVVTAIPATQPGIYQVTYSYTDANRIKVSDSRAIIVNDGRYEYDDNFILEALSFVIRASDVNPTGAMAQLLEKSEARAWATTGTPRAAEIALPGGYASLPYDYSVTVQVAGYPAVSKTITAKVINDGTGTPAVGDQNGDNGSHYSIIGANFRLNETEANALKSQPKATIDATLLAKGGVTIHDRTSSSFVEAPAMTRELVSDGGFSTTPGVLSEGQQFTLTVRCAEDTDATTTIILFVSNGGRPEITAPEVRYVWGGETSTMPSDPRWIAKENWISQNGMQGVSANDPEDHDLTAQVKVGTLTGSTFTEVKPITAASPVDLSKKNVYQDISYQVTDSDFNTVTKTVKVYVGTGSFIGDYFVCGYDFVETVANVMTNGTSDSVILGLANAKAWRYVSSDPSEELPAPANNVLKIVDNGGYKAEEGEYTIKIGVNPEPGYVGDDAVTHNVIGKVIDKDVIGDTIVDEEDARYFVGANNAMFTLAEANLFTGTSAIAVANLIDRAGAEAWKSAGGEEGFSDWEVAVLDNQIGSAGYPVVPNGSYEVTFIAKGVPGAYATVTFSVESNDPVIMFDEAPLVLQKTDISKPLSVADLKAKMVVTDVEDDMTGIDSWAKTTVAIAGVTYAGNTTLTPLDQANVGVWNATYSITDTDGNTTTASRAVIVDDGRYVIDPDNEVIIGARDFVIKSKGTGSVDGSEGQAKSSSYAEAYNFEGEEIPFSWTGAPSGYVANAEPGTYPLTWKTNDFPTSVTIKATVVDADYINSGDKSASYAIYGSDFTANLEQAAAILSGAPNSYITAAKVSVIPLVSTASAKNAVLGDNAGFRVEQGEYKPITFRIEGVTPTQDIGVTGTVSQGEPSVLTVPSPIEVWIGAPDHPRRSPSSILPADYTSGGGEMYMVSATDLEDDRDGKPLNITATAAGSAVDLAKVGQYKINYSVTDSDNNTVTAERIVVVNDGRYVVGNGRILEANSFITLLKDVTTNPGMINAEILDKSGATLYDGRTGTVIAQGDITVTNTDGYGPLAGKYNITLRGVDTPSGYLSMDIIGEVIDGDVIVTSGEYTVFGNNISLRPSEVPTTDADLLMLLSAGARQTLPTGEVNDISAIVTDWGNLSPALGLYTVTIADEGKNVFAALEVKVTTGGLMPSITADPKPLNVSWEPASSALVSREVIMTGVKATHPVDGDLTASVVINPDASGAEVLPTIPLNEFSVTQITYRVTDADGNVAQVRRALIVNDGSASFDEKYILRAQSFVIESKDVQAFIDGGGSTNTLILEQSGAQAWATDGSPATAIVSDSASLAAVKKDFRPILGIQEYAALKRTITAKVLDSTPPYPEVAGNGDTYAIAARDFRINIKDATALQAMSGAAYSNEFIKRSEAESYLRSDTNLAPSGTCALADDSGFKTATFAQPDSSDYPTIVPVKLWVTEDNTAFVWVNAIVSNGFSPWLNVPEFKQVDLNGSFTEDDYLAGVTYGDAEDDVKDLVLTHDSPVNTKVEGAYTVTYTVTDTEGNSTSQTGLVLVGPWEFEGDYAVKAWDFVTTVVDVEAATSIDDLVLALSHAEALHLVRDTATQRVIDVENWTPVVKDLAGFMAKKDVYTPIKIGVAAEAKPVANVTGRVLDKELISNTPDDDGNVNDTNTTDSNDTNRYIVAANNVILTWAQAGELAGKMDNVTQARLVAYADAEAFKIAGTGGMTSHNVAVKSNGIMQANGTYQVTFIPENVGGVEVTVDFFVDWGVDPIIAVDGPLRFDQAPASVMLTRNELLLGITVIDEKNMLTTADVVITDSMGAVPAIDKSVVGVTQVTYMVEDPIIKNTDGTPKQVSVTRAVIINDGRFDDFEDSQIIIGAKDFVVSSKDATFGGAADDVLRLSFAEAYDYEGNALEVAVVGTIPPRFAAKEIGSYPFRLSPVGYPEAFKDITGEIVDADVVDLGPDPYNAKYALIASNFALDVSDAAEITKTGGTGDAGLIAAAQARVVKLVKTAPDASVKVVDKGGFTDRSGWYDIEFGINGFTSDEYSALVEARVTNRTPPTLTVPNPNEIALGDPWNPMNGVSAWSPGDGDITDKVIYYLTNDPSADPDDIDTNVPGIYPITYEVTDSDGNTTREKHAIIINDGRYEIGEGRILEATGFVIRAADVATSANERIAQIKALSNARVFDATSGEELSPSIIDIDPGSYGKTAGTHSVVVSVKDAPSGTISKTIDAQVVAADVLEEDTDSATGNRVYVYGNNITMRLSEVQALEAIRPLAADRIVSDDALIEKLQAGAIITNIKTNSAVAEDVYIADTGGLKAAPGLYQITVKDVGNVTQAVLSVQVVTGSAPVITPERPVVVPVSNNAAYLTDTQKRGNSTASDAEDGNLTDKIKVSGNIPGNQPGIYQVTMSVIDSDGNTTQAQTALIVDDGNIVFNNNYVLYAKNFTIAHAAVNTSNRSAQIIERSGAYATRIDGTPVAVRVSNLGGYTNARGVYYPTIAVSADSTLTKQIAATVTQPDPVAKPLPRYTVTFNANGGRLTGPSVLYVQRPATTIAYLPSEPVRKGYSFNGWYTKKSGGSAFTASTPVNANRTVYAHWTKDAPPPQPRIVVNPPATYVNVVAPEPTVIPGPTELVEVDKTVAPTIEPPAEEKSDWSLFNVLIVMLSALLALAFLVKFFFDRRKDDDERERPAKQKSMYVNAPVLLIAIIAFIEGLVVLLVTQDFTAKMGIIDQYSLPMSLIVFVQLLAPMVAALLMKKKGTSAPAPQPQVAVRAPAPQTVQRTYRG
ncbi:MAG: DUF5011 domain-containing protein [Coriobacteriales bacterium]|jgi:uncharacterized repeat protein (TIGR02543 family)|nr:DUF5011 domain-containing protein [Coriobacteriales bacterium]